MRKNLLLLLLSISASICLNAQTTNGNEQTPKVTPESLVEQQVTAYNARNIDAFLVPYADSVELYEFPDKLIGKGKESMKQGYSDFFSKTPDLHCEIRARIVQGNTVVDKEHLTMLGYTVDAVAIYQIDGEKIKRVYVVR